MKKKTTELFSMLCIKTVDTENIRRLIITLLTDTDGKIWTKKLCNTVGFVQSINSDAQIKKKRLFI